MPCWNSELPVVYVRLWAVTASQPETWNDFLYFLKIWLFQARKDENHPECTSLQLVLSAWDKISHTDKDLNLSTFCENDISLTNKILDSTRRKYFEQQALAVMWTRSRVLVPKVSLRREEHSLVLCAFLFRVLTWREPQPRSLSCVHKHWCYAIFWEKEINQEKHWECLKRRIQTWTQQKPWR